MKIYFHIRNNVKVLFFEVFEASHLMHKLILTDINHKNSLIEVIQKSFDFEIEFEMSQRDEAY